MEQFSPDSKIWVYQADRELSIKEEENISIYLGNFCKDWTAHNQQLLAGFELLYHRFIILKVDETHTGASGCSIDKSVNALKELSNTMGIGFFNRVQLPYLDNDGIHTIHFNEVERGLEEKTISASTPFFDMNIKTLAQLDKAFLLPLQAHWAYPKV